MKNEIKLSLYEYVTEFTERGACQCGRCLDAPPNPAGKQPMGHTADLIFFKVKAKDGADRETLLELVKAHPGDYGPVNLLDGKEHSYLEIGGFVGDQGVALMLMGLGAILGLWRLMTPRSILGAACTDELAQQMAGMGYVAIQAEARP